LQVYAFGAAAVALLAHVPDDAWQTFEVCVQVTAAPLWHAPETQTSFWVQPFESVQAVRSAATGFEQTPVPGLQLPAMWQESLAVQVFAAPPWQTPAWQVMPVTQRSGPWQAVPFAWPKQGSFDAKANV
jgi:hypothetical protein